MMRDWLLANAFFAGMALVAAGLLIGGHVLVRLVHFEPDTQRIVMGCVAILVLFATGFMARYALKRLERR